MANFKFYIHTVPCICICICKLNDIGSDDGLLPCCCHYLNQCWNSVNSLAAGKFEWNFKYVIFKQILVIDVGGISCEIALLWMSLDFTDDQSTLVQVMAWCCQATSHYLSQCWPRSLWPYGVTRPLWVNWILGNKHQWNLNWTSYIFNQENAFRLENAGHFVSASMC